MASLSTVIAFATGRPGPPIESHHISLLLLPWGPVIVFGQFCYSTLIALANGVAWKVTLQVFVVN